MVGTLSLYRAGAGAIVVFAPGFRVTAPPVGLVVALGRDGYAAEATLGPLARPEGAQAYPVPTGLDIAAYTEVWLWDPAAGEPVGLARLTAQ